MHRNRASRIWTGAWLFGAENLHFDADRPVSKCRAKSEHTSDMWSGYVDIDIPENEPERRSFSEIVVPVDGEHVTRRMKRGCSSPYGGICTLIYAGWVRAHCRQMFYGDNLTVQAQFFSVYRLPLGG